MTEIEIPYTPRYPQGDIHKALESHRFAVLVAHRRLGKTVLAVNHLIKRAITDNKFKGIYGYLAPYRNQAEQIAWSYLKHYTEPIPMRRINEQKLSITLPNGAMIRIFGADNPDSLRGLYFDGVVIDEVAQIKPSLWGEVLRPALADRKGWAVFIGTPKGINLFSDMYDKALQLMQSGDEDWYAMTYSVDQTGVIDEKELQSLKNEMSENEFRQEFLCDFAAANDDALISIDLVRTASARHYAESDYAHAPLVFGIDVARFGNDLSTIYKRRGLVLLEKKEFRQLDNMELADRIAIDWARDNPDAVFIDAGGGQGVIDRLRQLSFRPTEVYFGGKAINPRYANRRTEMYVEMRNWLQSGGAIPPDQLLMADLSTPTYGYTPSGQMILEPKDKIKERIGRSPDNGDGLALTFAAPVRPRLDKRFEDQIYDSSSERYDPFKSFESDYWNR